MPHFTKRIERIFNMSNKKIYPLAFQLSAGQKQKIYYLGFPQTWKQSLLEIARKDKPNFKDEYGLPTAALKKLVDSWMVGVIHLAPLKKESNDERWLIACNPYSEKDLQALCDMIKTWIKATYVTSPYALPLVKQMANDFCDEIDYHDFVSLQTENEINLTFEDGTVCEEAYQAIPLSVCNRLLGQEIILNEQVLHLCYSAKNQLISQPMKDPKSQHQYSFVFDFSVQTTPPTRKALLLCQMSIRRWIPANYNKERVPFLNESINAHIRVSSDKFCQVPISYHYSSKKLDWKEQDRECYNIWGYESLPPVENVLKDPAAYAEEILLPYKNGMKGFVDSKIGTGVSVIDKAALHQAIYSLLGDMVRGQAEADRVKLTGQKFTIYKAPDEYESHEDFRSWVCQCAGTTHITFELYGLWKDSIQQELLKQVQNKLQQDFGDEADDSCLKIQFVTKEVGNLADAMPDNKKQTQIQRCEEIAKQLGMTDAVTACIFILPGREHYAKGDPKAVLRNAFARTGRVVQFINPEENINQHKVESAVHDLYRQLGIVTLLDFRKKIPPMADTPCIGMHLCTQVHGISNKARFLPIYITVNLQRGKVTVNCDAFSKPTVSYREACLEMAQLFWKNDLEQRCVSASRSPAKQKLLELRNHYYKKEDSVMFLVHSDGNTRAVWSGISDKEINGYTVEDEYCPKQINVGMPNNPYPLSLLDSGVRIIRIRRNQEVPDYFTNLSMKSTEEHLQYTSASGIFKYEDVYWGIHTKPNDIHYTNSFKESKIAFPRHRFAEKDMIEFYPLQLQPGDNAASWIFYANELRKIPIQYSEATVLPLPLHLAAALEEYLFEA